MISFPPWPESRYLARMAGMAPDCVLEVMLDLIFTDNASVHIDLAEAACAMPASLAAKWARARSQMGCQARIPISAFTDRLGKLVTHLVKGGETQAALALARSILAINPPADPGAEDADGWPDARARPLPRCEKYDYERVLESNIPQLVACGRPNSAHHALSSAEKRTETRSRVPTKAGPGVFSSIRQRGNDAIVYRNQESVRSQRCLFGIMAPPHSGGQRFLPGR